MDALGQGRIPVRNRRRISRDVVDAMHRALASPVIVEEEAR